MTNLNVVAIIQARLSSSRLPSKVIKTLNGREMFLYQLDRVAKCKRIDNIVLATSNDKSDDKIAEICKNNAIEYFRGDLDDVLGRFHHATSHYNADVIVRLTADCPLSDPVLIDEMVSFYLNHDFDYVSNGLKRTFPDGFDVEIFSSETLAKAYNDATLTSEREHVTPYIIKHPELFRLGSYEQQNDDSQYRVTVDYPEDFAVVSQIANGLGQDANHTWVDVVNFLRNNPDIVKLNQQFHCNDGYEKSVREDKVIADD